MRKPNQKEASLIDTDLKSLEVFLLQKNLYTDVIKRKYNKLQILIETDKNIGNVYGFTRFYTFRGNYEKQIMIILNEDILDNEELRVMTLYHEVGHILMGFASYEQSFSENIASKIMHIKEYNSDLLKEEDSVYFDGLILLEEYLVEKFCILMAFLLKGIPEPKVEYSVRHPEICGTYEFNRTFKTSCDVFENLCDDLMEKTYGNLYDTISSGLNETFLTGFFDKYDNVKFMEILGNFGHIIRAIYAYTGIRKYSYDSKWISKVLIQTSEMIKKINKVKTLSL